MVEPCRFDAGKGEVVLTLKLGARMLKFSETQFALPLLNPLPPSSRPCSTPTLQVSGSFSQGPVPFPAAEAGKRALEGGQEDGDICPLLVHRPQFTSRIISQVPQPRPPHLPPFLSRLSFRVFSPLSSDFPPPLLSVASVSSLARSPSPS